MKQVAVSARKSLSLRKDIVFRLMVVMTMLLGWLMSLGAGTLVGLENLYTSWQLEQRSRINVYLMAESSETQITMMTDDLKRVTGVKGVERLSRESTLALLEPYFDAESHFPVPIVMDIVVDDSLNRQALDDRIYKYFSTAEVDDARYLLESTGRGVRLAQMITFAVSGILLVVMALLMTLTVRAGLRGQRQSLSVLQYVGATDRFMTQLVTSQVLKQSLVGWVLAVALSGVSVVLVLQWQEGLQAYLSQTVIVVMLLSPLLLVALAVFFAWWTTRYVLQRV